MTDTEFILYWINRQREMPASETSRIWRGAILHVVETLANMACEHCHGSGLITYPVAGLCNSERCEALRKFRAAMEG
jgi:hypothetical protein